MACEVQELSALLLITIDTLHRMEALLQGLPCLFGKEQAVDVQRIWPRHDAQTLRLSQARVLLGIYSATAPLFIFS
jgi:hypothetical protein